MGRKPRQSSVDKYVQYPLQEKCLSELGKSGKIEGESLRIVGKGMRCPDVDMKIMNRLMIGKNCAQSL